MIQLKPEKGEEMAIKRLCYPVVVLFCVLVMAGNLYGIVASPRISELIQPDGSVVNARQWGDEWLHGWETREGYTIVKGISGFWVYADRDSTGKLYPANVRADGPAPEKQKRFLRPGGERARKAVRKRRKATVKVVPSTGTAKIPILLINYSDTTSTNTPSEFESLLFDTTPAIATGPGSMKDYYEEVSYGAFSVSSGPSGVSEWHTAANGHDYYGQNFLGFDEFPAELVKEAVLAADAAGFDFSQYDNDGDGKVEVVNIVHQGSGEEESGVATDIWSHSWSLTYAGVGSVSVDGVTVDDYVIQPERWSSGGMITIGVFAHEFGHALDLPDLYDTDYSSMGIGDWGLMASGSYNKTTNSGDSPAHMSAWCKYFLGWVTPTSVSSTLTNEVIDQADTTADVYQLLSGSKTSGEYFLVENRQKSGFDQGLPGDGLLIWHIDGTLISKNMNSNTVNDNECYPGGPSCAANHYGVVLEQADNLWQLEKFLSQGDDGDPYPGSANNTSFTDSSSPDSDLHDGNPGVASVTDISASGSQMTATLAVNDIVTTTTIPAESTTTISESTTTTVLVTTTTTTIAPEDLPDLETCAPYGWSYPIVPSSDQGTNTYDPENDILYPSPQNTYIDFAICNENNGTVTEPFSVIFYIDDIEVFSTEMEDGLEAKSYKAWMDKTFNLSEGEHTLRLIVDVNDDIEEANEDDNEFEINFTWGSPGWSEVYREMFGNDYSEKVYLLRDFRDKVLVTTWKGKVWVELLYKNSFEIASLLLEDSDLRVHALSVIEELLPEIEARLNGEEAVMSSRIIADTEDLLDEFGVRASPALKKAVKRVKKEIKKGGILPLI